MLTSPDFKELVKIFEKYKIRYLVVGGYAVMKYSEPLFTKDLDLFIATDQDNANNVYAVLREFGAPLEILPQMTSHTKAISIRWEARHCELTS